MIEFFDQRLHRVADAFVVVNPANRFIDHALDRDPHVKRVSVHLPAFVALRQGGQRVCGFKVKIFIESRDHGGKSNHWHNSQASKSATPFM